MLKLNEIEAKMDAIDWEIRMLASEETVAANERIEHLKRLKISYELEYKKALGRYGNGK